MELIRSEQFGVLSLERSLETVVKKRKIASERPIPRVWDAHSRNYVPIPWRIAKIAAWRRDSTFSLARSFTTWVRAVSGLM